MTFWSSPSTKPGSWRPCSECLAGQPPAHRAAGPRRTPKPAPRPDRRLGLHRVVRADAAHPRHHRLGRAVDGHRLHHRRKRHRQGTVRAGRPRQFQPRHRALHRAELRRDPAGPAGIRGLRPYEGQLHRRDFRQAGRGGGSGWRHAVSGRDLRNGPGAADQAPALPANLDRPAGGRHQAAQGQRPHRLRHQPRPAGGRAPRRVSAKTCTTGCSSCRSTCRPCATAARM
jgi:hypothetical protein